MRRTALALVAAVTAGIGFDTALGPVATLAGPPGSKEAAVWIPDRETACSIGAFVAETDPAGLNVRERPTTGTPVIGRLPPVAINPDDPSLRGMVEVQVEAGANGWFRIAGAQDNTELTGGAPRPMFTGTGWVSGRKLTVKSQARSGRSHPSREAAIVVASPAGFDSDALVRSAHLVACAGDWALVQWSPSRDGTRGLEVRPAARVGVSGGAFRAWVDRLCAIQETSCSDGGD